MEEDNKWATETLKEVPFWREGMTPEEYDIEREYFYSHWGEYTRGQYVPLWKQRIIEEADGLFSENMSSSQARIAFFGAVDGKTKEEIEALMEEYRKVARIISKREFQLAEEGWFVD